MFRQKNAIHVVPSACSRYPPVGSDWLRSKTQILSSPRNPPSKTLLSATSFRLTHQVKFRRSFAKICCIKALSPFPSDVLSALYNWYAAHACTGGFTSLKFHS